MNGLQRKQDDAKMKQLIIAYRQGNQGALVELVELCEPMVDSMSRKFCGLAMQKNIPIEDLKQECYLGLLGAVCHFPVDIENNNFSSFAFSSMNYQMLIYIRNNSNRIVKSDWRKGSIETESMNKELTSFGELEDNSQEEAFKAIEDEIDKKYLQQEIDKMLNDILSKDSNIELLKDIYGLNGQSYSMNDICQKHGISLKDLIFKERMMILKIKNDPKTKSYLERFSYDCKHAYHWGFEKFGNTMFSSTEFLAMKHLEFSGIQSY